MAKDVLINGVTYQAVPYVDIPLAAGGGNAKFVDTDSGDAAAGDIRSGKKAWAAGAEITGTAAEKAAADVTVSGKTVNVPAGLYDAAVSKSVADGAVTPGVAVSGAEIGDTESGYPITITPKAAVGTPGYVTSIADGAAVTKFVQTEEKSADPSTAAQDVTPSAGKLLSKVTVAAVALSGSATAADVLLGKTFYGTTLSKLTGTATVPTVSQDATTKVLSIA